MDVGGGIPTDIPCHLCGSPTTSELEDWSRRNNLRLRGLPEATGVEDLADSTLDIFRDIAGDAYPANLTFDRIHRALGPRSSDTTGSVVCTTIHTGKPS